MPTGVYNRPDLSTRFWSKVNRGDDTECWPWIAYRDPHGYGRIRIEGNTFLAHRVAYEMLVGPIPEGLVLDHLCRNPPCVNPAHLEAVTQFENMRRSDPGAFNQAKTHCPKGHPYDEENTRMYQGRRFCRECKRISDRERRKKAARQVTV